MNESIARVSLVLTARQAEALRYVAMRTGATQSAIARDVFGEPVLQLAAALRSVPMDAGALERAAFMAAIANDVETTAAEVVAELRRPVDD